MSDTSNVINQMNNEGLTGLTEADLIIDGQLHRFRPDWEPKKSKKRGWYALFPFNTDSGERLIAGAFGWFKGADSYSFTVEIKPSKPFSPVELARLKREQDNRQRLAEQERQRQKDETAKRAAEIWGKLPKQGVSQYLQRKKVGAFNIRFSRGSIVLPVYGFDKKLTGLQFIDADGNKKFLTGTVKKGRFCILGNRIAANGFMAIAEGYCTAASIHMATGWLVFVAFDAGNLIHVAITVRNRYPAAKIVIGADDDIGNPDNPGKTKAEEAARAVNGIAVYPTWRAAA